MNGIKNIVDGSIFLCDNPRKKNVITDSVVSSDNSEKEILSHSNWNIIKRSNSELNGIKNSINGMLFLSDYPKQNQISTSSNENIIKRYVRNPKVVWQAKSEQPTVKEG